MTVRQLLASLDSREITEWLAHDELTAFEYERERRMAGK